MKKTILLLIITIICLIISTISLNHKVKWVVCDTYGDYKDCYYVKVRVIDDILKNGKEEYEYLEVQ